MCLLAVETSCDETGVALVKDGRVLSNVVSSQIALHAEYGGVVPELAAREHLRNLLPVARLALRQAGLSADVIEAVAATLGPGFPNALVIGCRAAQAAAFVLGRPFLGIHHHEAHLYSPWISGDPPTAAFEAMPPHVSLIVSGGHTMLVHVRSEFRHRVLGSTLDDAAGECFDKVGKLLGLPYPGGPELDRLAREGNPFAVNFPRPMIHAPDDDFSFSGLKTAVRYYVRDDPGCVEDRARVCDLCASVQAAIVEVLVSKTISAAGRLGVSAVTASGGVTCNSRLRHELDLACRRHGYALRLADRRLCTDNAAMIGILAERKWRRGLDTTPLDADIRSNWALEELESDLVPESETN